MRSTSSGDADALVALASEVARDVGVLLLPEELGGPLGRDQVHPDVQHSSLTQTSPEPDGPHDRPVNLTLMSLVGCSNRTHRTHRGNGGQPHDRRSRRALRGDLGRLPRRRIDGHLRRVPRGPVPGAVRRVARRVPQPVPRPAEQGPRAQLGQRPAHHRARGRRPGRRGHLPEHGAAVLPDRRPGRPAADRRRPRAALGRAPGPQPLAGRLVPGRVLPPGRHRPGLPQRRRRRRRGSRSGSPRAG